MTNGGMPGMVADVIEQLKQIIAKELDVNLDPEEIDENAPLFEEGIGLDSIAIMDFILLIEARFGFEFVDTELNVGLFRDLATLADFVSAKVNTRGAGPVGTT
jgi:acyl carrier protein